MAPKVAATLANYYADWPLEVRCWDPHEEACDLMCRVMRLFFKEKELKYRVLALELDHALDKADGLIICGEHSSGSGVMVPSFRVPVSEIESPDKYKFQALRWINQEDDPLLFIHEEQDRELLEWLNSF